MQHASKLGGMVLCDDETHAATADEIRVVPMRPTTLKGKVAPVIPLRPVASSDLLEMPKLSANLRYCIPSNHLTTFRTGHHCITTNLPGIYLESTLNLPGIYHEFRM